VWHLLFEVLKRVQHDGDIHHPELVILNLFQDIIIMALTVLDAEITPAQRKILQFQLTFVIDSKGLSC